MVSVSRFSTAATTVLEYARSANQRFHSRNYRWRYNRNGIDVFEEDWDTLVILDGCRYDTFARYEDLPGELEKRESRGSMTVEFLRGNVAGRELTDTVYVTANGQFYNYEDELDATFHHVENVWRHDAAWDDVHHTVLPETLTRYALRAAERFPHKRLLVHYVQPHYPFIEGPIDIDDAFDPETPDFWNRVLFGDLDYDESTLRRAYTDNLERALPHVVDLLAGVQGRTVVTSDHGNMLGTRSFPVPHREWGHPPKLWVSELTDVPWLVHESGDRPAITSDPPTVNTSLLPDDGEETDVHEHLRHLGYVE
jgi:hypothetical protein